MGQTDAGECRAKSIAEDLKSLSVDNWRDKLFLAVAENRGLIVVGETRSQRTNQCPQYLNEGGKIGHTHPQRVAATFVAVRAGDNMGVAVLGDAVGYAIPFEDCPSPKIVINYMTDRMFLRDIMTEHDRAGYATMIFD
ncbi:hypothetical protein O181_117091 [Austropuccinia psidii MF-1]|uniref:Uncharacterized protein n=1 Tax=Austropuccinia psidii MF-1 TaxID=1389203 RepID=A0A9Q3KC08_9BASI|nr:hypothetical protein [Austropuccinia psidii MF-1]